jgi:hypothetical protein
LGAHPRQAECPDGFGAKSGPGSLLRCVGLPVEARKCVLLHIFGLNEGKRAVNVAVAADAPFRFERASTGAAPAVFILGGVGKVAATPAPEISTASIKLDRPPTAHADKIRSFASKPAGDASNFDRLPHHFPFAACALQAVIETHVSDLSFNADIGATGRQQRYGVKAGTKTPLLVQPIYVNRRGVFYGLFPATAPRPSRSNAAHREPPHFFIEIVWKVVVRPFSDGGIFLPSLSAFSLD